LARRLLSAIAFLLALLVRALPGPMLFASERTHLPFAGDAYYHLRRIQYSVAHFPDTLEFDPWSETIDVAERAVRNGERVVGPDLSPTDGST
jgi:hypothetical protein